MGPTWLLWATLLFPFSFITVNFEKQFTSDNYEKQVLKTLLLKHLSQKKSPEENFLQLLLDKKLNMFSALGKAMKNMFFDGACFKHLRLVDH
ncbi:hypothetical protein T07_13724 [Trichinella nelsoni]|uniref:Uncharacterized protein n=1 Tax=Trichinella nelsoni TaxID=6336 RepID=A0A0V0S9A2_9BILA|nr:hypothetical protein T07_13724 [Trichinella nelsoni]